MSTEASRVGCYLLPGTNVDPRTALAEAAAAEAIGLSAVWIAEKYDVKDLPSLAGAVAATTESVRIGAAVTHIGLRHPLTIASMGQTLQALSGGRFRLGFGRAAPQKWAAAGVPQPTLSAFRDLATILRRLWAGERVEYRGPAGQFPSLKIAVLRDVPPPPLFMAAIGPKTLEMAGRHYDGVILHPFLTPHAVSASAAIARAARSAAGLDQAGFEVIAAVVVAPDTDRPQQLQLVAARAVRYFGAPSVGGALVEANGWDASHLPELARGERSAAPIETAANVPIEWLTSASATGGLSDRGTRLKEYLAAGADELILHGGTVHELRDVAALFGGRR